VSAPLAIEAVALGPETRRRVDQDAWLLTMGWLGIVFGHSLGRGDALPARPRRESLAVIVRATWPRGVALVDLAALAAATLRLLRPGAESPAEAFR